MNAKWVLLEIASFQEHTNSMAGALILIGTAYLLIFSPLSMTPSLNPRESKGINQQLDGFSRLRFLEMVAFQTATEHSCRDCVTKHRNSSFASAHS